MRSRYLVLEPGRPHFVTGTIVEWLPGFTSAAACDILVRAFAHPREHQQLRIHSRPSTDLPGPFPARA